MTAFVICVGSSLLSINYSLITCKLNKNETMHLNVYFVLNGVLVRGVILGVSFTYTYQTYICKTVKMIAVRWLPKLLNEMTGHVALEHRCTWAATCGSYESSIVL